jgi:hypothetical protein
MASTYVNDLRLNEMATGDGSGTWGTTTNTNLELIGEALGYGTEAITTNADTHTSTIADGATDPVRAMYVKYTGTLDSACTITIAPNTVNRMHFIENGTSGSQNIIISQGSGANVTIPPGDTKAVYLDGAGSGAAVVDAFASLSVVDLKVQDDLTITDDLTFSSDSAVVTFGADGDTTLTHTDGTGLTLNSTNKLCFNDASQFVQGSSATVLSLGATDEIDLTATAIDINGTLDVSGQATFADGSAGAPSISNTGDVNAGLFFSAADVMSFSAGGTAQFTMADGSISPVTDNDIDLGTASLKYKSFFAGLVDSENFKVNGGQGSDGQVLTSTGSGVAWEDAASGASSINDLSDAKTFGTSSIMLGDATTGTISGANYNVGLGVDVFSSLTSGDSNVAIGFDAADTLTTGSFNIAIGTDSLGAAGAGVANNVMIGYNTGSGLTGDGNVAIGHTAFDAAGDRDDCVAIGNGAATTLTTGSHNIAIGTSALGLATDAHSNVAIGFLAASSLATGAVYATRNNIAIGREALENQVTQEDNIAIGYNALGTGNSVSNSQLTVIGSQAGNAAHAAYGGTYVGYQAGSVVTSGVHNTFIGREAGDITTTGDRNIMIGVNANGDDSAAYRCIVISTYENTGKGDATFFISAGTGSGNGYQGNNSSAWATTSDRRIKKNIVDNNVGLEKIKQIQVKNFEYRTKDEITDWTGRAVDSVTIEKEGTQLGVIAQEIQEILPDVVQERENGCLSVDSDNITWYLVNAVKQQQTIIDDLKSRIEALED